MKIMKPEELNAIRKEAREVLQCKINDYADHFCTEITSQMLVVAANPGKKGYDTPTCVKLDFSTNSELETIVMMRKNREIKYLSSALDEIIKRFTDLGYKVDQVNGRGGDYNSVTIAW